MHDIPDTEAQASPRTAETLDDFGIVMGEIAHDFDNALSLVFGYVEMALSELPEGTRARSDLEHALATGERARELVERILTYSNRSKPAYGDINLEKPLRGALDFLRRYLPEGVTLRSEIVESDARVRSHGAAFQQLVLNLCNNALQAMAPGGGELEVKLDYFDPFSPFWLTHDNLKRCPYARLTVRDSGRGMDLHTLERMYAPFFSGERREDGRPRAGLGLTTVYNIVSAHEGVIFVDSEPGRGTRFEVCLPVAGEQVQARGTLRESHSGTGRGFELPAACPEAAAAAQAQARPAPETAGDRVQAKHILLVDDQTASRESLRALLEKQGYRVTALRDPAEALTRAGSPGAGFDLVITDLVMPGMSGAELARRLSAGNADLPILLAAPADTRLSAASCRQWGVRALVTRPWSSREVLDAVRELI